MIDIKVKKLYPDAIIPTKAYYADAGWDLYIHHFDGDEKCLAYRLYINDIATINTGIALEIPVGYCGLIFDRSGLGSKGIMRLMGVIDSGYRGEIIVKVTNVFRPSPMSQSYIDLSSGDKIAQLLIVPVHVTRMVEAQELDFSERGEKGFGSSGS